MVDIRITLAGLWVALMLTNLLGDVLRIFAGDIKAGEIEGVQVTQTIWMAIAVFSLIPIVMVVLSLTLPYPAIRSVTIVAAIFLFGVNLLGLPTYPGAYDKFLIMVGLVFTVLIAWYAWRWVQ